MKTLLARVLRRAADRLDPRPEPAPLLPSYWITPPPTINAAGWPCALCGTFVPYGIQHMCNGVTVTCNNKIGAGA